MDVPPNATERVVSRFGPGPAREVLAELLNGSHFNYVLMGSAADPNSLERVILTPKLPSGPDAASQLPVNSAAPNGFALRSEEGSAGANAAEMADDPADDNDNEVVDPAAQGANPDQPPNNRPAIKTPEQLLQELQRQQQLQQQPGGPQDPAAPAPTPPQAH